MAKEDACRGKNSKTECKQSLHVLEHDERLLWC